MIVERMRELMPKTDADLGLATEVVQALLAARKSGIPAELLAQVRLYIADAIGIATAARTTDMATRVLRAQRAAAGDGACKLIGGGTAAPMAAAFVNSALIHILDYDDIHDAGRLHPGTVVLPAVLAAADIAGATDRVIEDAVALSAELMCKLGVACAPRGDGPGSEWFLTQVFGYAAAAVGAGLALGLNEQQLISAIGLSYMQVAGGKEAGFGTGSNARSIYPAFAAQGGLQAALMARAGVVGPASALDGAAGLFRIYFGAQLARARRRLLTDFSRWQYRDVQTKPWPSCRLSHPYIAVALDARKTCLEHPDARIRVAVNASAARLCRPIAERRRPLTLQDAKYSIPFMTAFALVRGDPGLTRLDDLALRDTAVLDMAMRVEIDETLADKPGHPMAVLTLEQGRRKLLTSRFRPAVLTMDAGQTQGKFKDCLAYAGVGGSAKRVWKHLMQGKVRLALRQITVGDD